MSGLFGRCRNIFRAKMAQKIGPYAHGGCDQGWKT